MRIKVLAAKLLAKKIHKDTLKWTLNPVETQQKVFRNLIKVASKTKFGIDHSFSKIKTFSDFANFVPVRDYEDIKTIH